MNSGFISVLGFFSALRKNFTSTLILNGSGMVDLLLDIYPAAVGVSLRRLSNAYMGACIRVRRSSDNAEQDIGFLNGTLDQAALLAFCGVDDGFVTIWYDQSGNGRNAVPPILANQPLIVSAGVINTKNGLPSVLLDGSDLLIFLASTTVYQNIPYSLTCGVSAASVQIAGTMNVGAFTTGTGVTRCALLKNVTANSFNVSGRRLDADAQTLVSGVGHNTDLDVLTSEARYSDNVLAGYRNLVNYANGVFSSGAGNTSNTPSNINGRIGASFNGYISEYIVWNTNQSANIIAILTDVTNYYGL